MDPNKRASHVQGQEPVVTPEVLKAAIAEQKACEPGYDPLGTEPVLKEHLYEEMLKVCGKMGLAGAPTVVLQGVRMDMERLLDLTVATLQAANHELWKDLLPQPDVKGLRVRPSAPPVAEDEIPF